jgi:hypothetical protein
MATPKNIASLVIQILQSMNYGKTSFGFEQAHSMT